MLPRRPRRPIAASWSARMVTAGLVAAAGLLAAAFHEPVVKAAAPDEVPAFDVSHVPNEAVAVVMARLPLLREVPVLEDMVQMLAEAPGPLAGFERPLERFQQAAWVQLVYPPADARTPPFAFGVAILTSDEAAALAEVAEMVAPQATEREFAGQTVFIGREGTTYFQPDDRTLVFGSGGAMRDYLVIGTRGNSRLTRGPAWEAVEESALVVSADPRTLRGEPLVKPLAPFAPLWEQTRQVTLGLTADAERLSLRAAADAEDAEAVEATVRAALVLGKNTWRQVRAEMMAEDRHHPEDVFALIGLRLAGELLQSAAVEREGDLVTLSAQATMPPAQRFAEALRGARAQAQRAQSTNNLRQIALAMHIYHDAHQTFPAPAIYGEEGEPLLSWRVAILPFVEQAPLYEQFRLDEPWDSPPNLALLDRMPSIYRSPFDDPESTNASYFVFTGEGTVFPGGKGVHMGQITDGVSNTLLAVEARREIPWTKPEDIPYDGEGPLPELGGFVEGSFPAAFCDGSVRIIEETIDRDVLRAMIERASGRAISMGMERRRPGAAAATRPAASLEPR